MKFAVLDFETTGSQPADEIIQVGLVIIDQFQIVDRYTSLVKPGIGIPSSITTLTGITEEMVADAPSLDQVMSEMFPLLFDCVLVGHHVSFDLSFCKKGLPIQATRHFQDEFWIQWICFASYFLRFPACSSAW
ncbi:PolC-type DNA polymerase III [Paenibacillus sp. N3.4]|uniref:3'-5' exonuclease n=1 Tax=Paenibacillus sp. N3.4 TaxID=2603222 RepID=UPI0021C3D354|nr:3'-5' exonuclease [Paenibacillus sp. N3.4]